MKCIDEEYATDFFGGYNTDKGSNLMVVFEKCDKTKSKSVCKDDDIIE